MSDAADGEGVLVARFVEEGDRGAFETLVRLHLPSIRRFIAVRLPDRDEAEEAEQDVLVRMYQSLRLWKGDSALRTWIFRLCSAAAADLVRRKAREKARSRRFLLGRVQPESRDADRAEWATERESAAAIVRRSLRRLGEPNASLVFLRDAEGLGIEELSAVFGLRQGTVKSRLARSRARLRDLLAAEGLDAPLS